MTTNIDLSQFDFSGSFKDINKGLIIKPVIQNYLHDLKTRPELKIHLEQEQMHREPDGWFHPSTHPTWSEGALYRYLIGNVEKEKMTAQSILAVTFGTLMHEFIQACMTDAGIRPAELQVCQVCPPEKECKEAGVKDETVGERGHVDAIFSLSHIPNVPSDKFRTIGEIKSVNAMSVGRLEDNNLEQFKTKYPYYYGQQQSYMRMSGLPWSLVLMISTSYPFEMKEYHIPFDPIYSKQITDKYLRVREAVAFDRNVICCGLKDCKAYDFCKQTKQVL